MDTLRVRTWYWNVKIASGLTDHKLNEAFPRSGANGAPRTTFDKIRREGVVPEDIVSTNLVSRIDGCYPDTVLSFRSRFWELLRFPAMDMDQVHLNLDALSLIVAPSRIAGKTLDQKMKAISQIVTLDSAAILGLLYKKLVALGHLERAIRARDAFIETVVTYAGRLESHASEPHIVRHQASLERDAHELIAMALDRAIHHGRETFPTRWPLERGDDSWFWQM